MVTMRPNKYNIFKVTCEGVASHESRSFIKGAAFIKSARPDTHSLTDGVLIFAGTVGPRGDIEYNIQFCKTKDNCYQNRIRCYSLYHVLQFTLEQSKFQCKFWKAFCFHRSLGVTTGCGLCQDSLPPDGMKCLYMLCSSFSYKESS
uniref:Uncharacterized protein n=1 Tax=Glossina morsitans morsitans TaxID=37546 RepID=A0A1B0FEA6_GLOMM